MMIIGEATHGVCENIIFMVGPELN